MILIRVADIGRPAYARLVRSGCLAPVCPGVARPLDVPDSPGLRALAAAPQVPRHVVLSGLAALWVHGWLPRPPERWHGVGARGLYRPPGVGVGLHSGVTAAEGLTVEGGLRLAPPARACLDALRWEDPAAALGAVLTALQTGALSPVALRAALAQEPRSGNGYSRLASLAAAVLDVGVPVRDASRP